MQIRKYTEGDRGACIAVIESNIPLYFTPQEKLDFAEWLSKEAKHPFFVILNDESEVVGCGGVYLSDDKTECGLSWGMIHSNYHKKGYGEALTTFRLNIMNEEWPEIPHIVRTSQHTSGFYARFGFVTYAHTPDGFGPGIDKVEMKRKRD